MLQNFTFMGTTDFEIAGVRPTPLKVWVPKGLVKERLMRNLHDIQNNILLYTQKIKVGLLIFVTEILGCYRHEIS